jgi:hypothetical protein
MPHVRLSVEADVHDLDGRLRHADLIELEAHKIQASSALRVGLAASDPCYTLEHQGRCIAMFGATPAFGEPRMGNVWLLGSDEISEVSTPFLRQSHKWLERIANDYEALSNVVHEDNELHHKWLKFLGFQFIRRRSPWIEFARIF